MSKMWRCQRRFYGKSITHTNGTNAMLCIEEESEPERDRANKQMRTIIGRMQNYRTPINQKPIWCKLKRRSNVKIQYLIIQQSNYDCHCYYCWLTTIPRCFRLIFEITHEIDWNALFDKQCKVTGQWNFKSVCLASEWSTVRNRNTLHDYYW